MHQDSQNRSFPSANTIKHLLLEPDYRQESDCGYSPFFYLEARIDFSDIRTGFRSTVSLNKAVEIRLVAADFLWTEDMVRDIDPRRIKSPAPDTALSGRLPDVVDAGFMSQMETHFIQYLLRTFKTRVYRNFELNSYSNAGESLSDFAARCMDLLDSAKRSELDALQDLFTRKLEQIKQKYLNPGFSENLDQARVESQDKDLFLGYSDRIADFFMKPEAVLGVASDDAAPLQNKRDLEERLVSLRSEVRQAIIRVLEAYELRARSVDEYILHPNLKDIHFVRCCILWIPESGG